MTGKEIIAKIEEADISVEDFAYGYFDSPEGVGEYEEVYQHGGEGEGDHWESVKYFKDHNIYIRTIGHYQSHYGTEFYNGYGEEVRPQEKVVTVYV